MSYSDYLAGLRDGFTAGFNAGYRKGCEDRGSAGYLAGYRHGYQDASMGLPYRPQERLLEYRSTFSEPLPLPKIEPLPLPRYEPPKLGLPPNLDPIVRYEAPKVDLTPKIDPLPKLDPLPDFRTKLDPAVIDPLRQFDKSKKPWEF
ncbi:MAG: hypothetical protein ACYTEL_17835 [Planctomycetota bacterium]|jgi:hypothetical protein